MIKKAFLFSIGLLVLVPGVLVNALRIDPVSGLFDAETVVDAKLYATPFADDQNGLSVMLSITGGEFVDFVPEINSEWVALTKDCNNGESYFTADSVCLSLAKTTPITQDELIGVLSVKVSGTEQTKIVKVEGTKYTNGVDTVESLGDAALYFTPQMLLDVPVSAPTDEEQVTPSSDTALLVLGFILLVVIALLVGGYVILRKRNVNLRRLSSSGKVVAIIMSLVVLGVSTVAVGIAVTNNQAPEESAAAVIDADCPAGTTQKTIAGTITCQCNNNANLTLNPGASNNLGCYPGSCPPYTTKKIVGGNPTCQCNNASELTINVGAGDASGCYIGSCPSGTTKKVGVSGAYCQCNNNTEIALNLNATNSNSCGSGQGTGNQGTGNEGTGNQGTGNQGTGNTGTGSSGGGQTSTPRKAVCGESCNTDADCATSGFGVTVVCNANKKCASPACPNDTEPGTLCGCKTAAGKCGDRCGIWSDGFQPLCGDGISTCSWINGPTCGGNNKTYCLPITVTGGFQKRNCTQESGYQYIVDAQGNVVTTQAQISQLCNPVTPKTTCYRCTLSTSDSNTCESQQVDGTSCPSGWTTNSNCAQAAGGSCSTDTIPIDPDEPAAECGNMDSDGDGKLTVIDFASFAQNYNKSCSNSGFTPNSCGSRDTNNDGKIDIVDFASFANRYDKPSCAI